jgi:hypothetical protein
MSDRPVFDLGDKVMVKPHGIAEIFFEGVVTLAGRPGAAGSYRELYVELGGNRSLLLADYGIGPWVDMRTREHWELERPAGGESG